MLVDGRRQRRHVPREPLRQKKVVRRAVHGSYRCVSNTVKAIQPVEPGLHLPLPPRELDPPFRYPDARLGAEQRVLGTGLLAAQTLVGPELPKFRHQGVGEEDVADTAALGDLGADPDAGSRRPVRRISS